MFLKEFEQRIRSVDWARYRQGHGNESIADNLVDLVTTGAAAEKGYQPRLEGQLLPQGVMGEAALYAIPFLVEAIEKEQQQTAVYQLLGPIVSCSRPDAADEEVQVGGVSRSLTQMCREEIGRGLQFYLRDVQNTALSRDCRSDAICVVFGLPERRATWLPIIKKAYDDEKDVEMRRELAEWLSDE